ncbi:hypothetical protein FOMA001_g13732 [Fusarium oxysporum f. sp. matthiolae]|nr:hypothetical protein FOMA001_g13732 [Fusarium oxysporum f. sp. matthiolae]
MPQSSYMEDDVIQAILDVTENGLTQNQAAQKNGVPPTTLSDRLRGLPSKSEVTQPAQLLSKSEESRLVTWILRQEALGYAPSHSQVRATVAALLRQQGRERPIGVHWLARFIKRHDDIKTKVGKRQEAARFNSFTPIAVNWYFDIRESEYGWIKPENTVNVDEGGIMAGFGLDSLVIGSSDPRRKALLKGSQSRTWTTFIEAVTADGRLLKPGIIFKGKELQQQWFIDELRGIADWYYITSDNGWTDNHIAVEWLKEVYLPQTQPADESDARLIILDGHGSHVSPLDNGVFNVSKAAYRKELQKLASLTDSAPVDKVNFIKAYAKAREVGMTKKNILSGWRVTGNWPISRRKALIHPEIQPDKKEATPGSDGHRDGQVDSDNTPKTSRHIRDMGKNMSPSTRRRYSVISKGFEAQESKIASLSTRIASLEEEVGRLSRGKKRKAIPDPNKRFMTLAESLVTGETISKANEAIEEADAVEDVIEVGGMEEVESSNSEEELGGYCMVSTPELDHVRLIATGRPEAELQRKIPHLIGNEICLLLDKDAINADIRSYVMARLERSPEFAKWASCPSVLKQIRNEIGGKPDGMFRWAACQLDSLETCLDREGIETALKSLPQDLNETYNRMLQRIPPERKHKAIRLLQFLVYSERPLTLKEAVDVIAVRIDSRPGYFDPQDRLPCPSELTRFCPSLVSIVHDSHCGQDAVGGLQLAHFSVKKYLLNYQVRGFLHAEASIVSTQTCLAYLDSLEEEGVAIIKSQLPLAKYAAKIWMDYTGPAEVSKDVVAAAVSFLENDVLFRLWTRLYQPDMPWLVEPGTTNASCLYFACFAGLTETVRVLLSTNRNVNSQGGYYGNSLQAASYGGHKEVVRLLLDKEADVNAQRSHYGNALEAASSEGHEGIVSLLWNAKYKLSPSKRRRIVRNGL